MTSFTMSTVGGGTMVSRNGTIGSEALIWILAYLQVKMIYIETNVINMTDIGEYFKKP